jgi:hypothetical protein
MTSSITSREKPGTSPSPGRIIHTIYYLLVEQRISKVPEVPPTSIHDRLPAGEVLEDKNAENARVATYSLTAS